MLCERRIDQVNGCSAPAAAFRFRISPDRMHRCLAPEITHQSVALFAQRTKSLPASAAGALPRDDPDVAGHRFPSGNGSGSPKNTSVAKAVTGPTSGCVIGQTSCLRVEQRLSDRFEQPIGQTIHSLLAPLRGRPRYAISTRTNQSYELEDSAMGARARFILVNISVLT
jgi:hypothetical protein